MYFQPASHQLLLLLFTETLIRHTLALGINCRGSLICATMSRRGLVTRLGDMMRDGLDLSCIYPNGQHIACASTGSGTKGVCAFLQGTVAGLKGDEVLILIAYLASHDCDNCGSVPIGYPESNDPSAGILTVNFVHTTDNPCPGGICFKCNAQQNVIAA